MWSTTSQTPTQVFTPFGGGYIEEHHGDEERSYLAAPEVRETVDFSAVLAALRAALFLR